jgi:tRNA modification GTPase
LVLNAGAKIAEPGEFTKRAFIHGRIDLTRAETVMDVISAESEAALKIASANITGELAGRIEEMIFLLTGLITETEATIDFEEDMDEEVSRSYVLHNVKNCIFPALNELLENHAGLNVFREGIKISIIGKPNVGKSSLLNILLKKDRAIVSEFPGTTRDAIEEMIPIKGMNVWFADTAGIRKTEDPVEKIGVEKTRERLKDADLVLFVMEKNSPPDENDEAVFQEIENIPYIIVVNKMDKQAEGEDFRIPEQWMKTGEPVYTSAKTGEGIRELTERIFDRVGANVPVSGNCLVPNARQARSLENARNRVESAIYGLETGLSLEFINIDLKECLEELGRVVGRTIDPDILENIFSRFCIGK